jgi:3-oxoadipate CoA-transferase beta subunit
MDLAIGAKSVFVMMTLFARDGSPKLVPACTYPLTGVGCVDRVYTDHAVFEITGDGICVRETFGTTYDELAARIDVPLLRPDTERSG